MIPSISQPTVSLPLKTLARPSSKTKDTGGGIVTQGHQVLTRLTAVAMPACLTTTLSATNVIAISIDYPLLDLCSWSQSMIDILLGPVLLQSVVDSALV